MLDNRISAAPAIRRKISLALEDRELRYSLLVLVVVSVLSIALTMQGWRSRITAFDLLTYVYDTRGFLDTGEIPQFGDTGSYGSYSPPGTAWLLLPGAIFFADPRLSEYTGAAFLHVLTLLGVFLLARSYLGNRAAILAVLLYGFTEHALFFAGSLWPIARPDFYVWIAYLASRWVARKDARFLAAALVVSALGLYVDLAVVPALFIFPVAWIYYKPPVRLWSLLVPAVISLVVFMPYLRFEAGRGFADLRSQLLLQNIFPADYRRVWCDPGLQIGEYQDGENAFQTGLAQAESPVSGAAGLFKRVIDFLKVSKDNLLANYLPIAPIPGASYLLLLFTLAGVLLLNVTGDIKGQDEPHPVPSWSAWLIRIALGLILAGIFIGGLILLANLQGKQSFLLADQTRFIYKLCKIFLLSGAALAAGIWALRLTNRVMIRLGVTIQSTHQAIHRRMLGFSLLVPWLILLLVAEPGKPERFTWLWPLQCIYLASFFLNILTRLKFPPRAIWAGQALAIMIVAWNPTLLSRAISWYQSGWAGSQAEEIQVVDYIARHVKEEGRDHAAVGYKIFIYPFMASYNITNPIYKVGAEIDLLFLSRHSIANANQCAEGIAFDDEYRIVEKSPRPWTGSPSSFFILPSDDRFHLVYELSSFQVYKRD